jgi:predicted small lipoprotein YifL
MRVSLLIIAALTLGLTACHQEGPAERAGKHLDNAGQSVSDTLNPPQGPSQSVGRKVDRALGD